MKQLELVDDGRVIIRTKNRATKEVQEWILERPTLGEYRRCVELAAEADGKLKAAVEAVEGDDERVRVSGELQTGAGGQTPLYASVVRAYIEMLAEVEPPDVEDLPSWAVNSRACARMIGHWRAVPLDLGPSVPAP